MRSWFHVHSHQPEWNYGLWQASIHDKSSKNWKRHENRLHHDFLVRCLIWQASQHHTAECNQICIDSCWSSGRWLSKRTVFVGWNSSWPFLGANAPQLAVCRLSRVSWYLVSGFQRQKCQKWTEFQHFCRWNVRDDILTRGREHEWSSGGWCFGFLIRTQRCIVFQQWHVCLWVWLCHWHEQSLQWQEVEVWNRVTVQADDALSSPYWSKPKTISQSKSIQTKSDFKAELL